MNKIILALLLVPVLGTARDRDAHVYPHLKAPLRPPVVQEAQGVGFDITWDKNSNIIITVDNRVYMIRSAQAAKLIDEHRQEFFTDLSTVLAQFSEQNFTQEEIDHLGNSLEKLVTLIPEFKNACEPLVVKYSAEFAEKWAQWHPVFINLANSYKQRVLTDLNTTAARFSQKRFTQREINLATKAADKAVSFFSKFEGSLRVLLGNYTKEFAKRLQQLDELNESLGQRTRLPYRAFSNSTRNNKTIFYSTGSIPQQDQRDISFELVLTNEESNIIIITGERAYTLKDPQVAALFNEYMHRIFTEVNTLVARFINQSFTPEEQVLLSDLFKKAVELIPEFKDALKLLTLKYSDELMKKYGLWESVIASTAKSYGKRILTDIRTVLHKFIDQNFTEEEVDLLVTSGMKAIYLIPELKKALVPFVMKYADKLAYTSQELKTATDSIHSGASDHKRLETRNAIRKHQQLKKKKI